MAEKITELTPRRRGPAPLYPWDQWADGSAWRIKQGEDFQIAPASMGAVVRNYANRTSQRVSVRVGADHVEFQFNGDTEAAA